jgi:hypothetical protein
LAEYEVPGDISKDEIGHCVPSDKQLDRAGASRRRLRGEGHVFRLSQAQMGDRPTAASNDLTDKAARPQPLVAKNTL